MQQASTESQTTPLLHAKTSGNHKMFTGFLISPERNLSSLLHSSSSMNLQFCHNILELYNVLVQIRVATSKTKFDI